MDPFKDIWRQDFEHEVNEALEALENRPSRPALENLSESVIPKAETIQELHSTREKLGSLENTLAELRRRHELRSRQLEEELRRRDRLKDVIIRLNMSLRRLERDGEESVRKLAARDADTGSLAEQLRESQEQRQKLEDALSSEKEQSLQARLKSDELQARLENMLLRFESKENALRAMQARLDAASRDFMATQGEHESTLNSLRREIAQKEADLSELKLRLENAEAQFHKEKNALELSAGDLHRRLEHSQEQVHRGEQELTKSSLDGDRLRERLHLGEMEMQAMKGRLEAALAAGVEAAKTQENLRRYEAELNESVLEKMKALREERAALLAEADAAMRQAQAVSEQWRAAMERSHKAELDSAHDSALSHEAVQAHARLIEEKSAREIADMRRSIEEERVGLRRSLAEAQEQARRAEDESARKEADLFMAVKADREALENRLRASYDRLRQEEAAARQSLEAEGSRLRFEAEAALREAHKIEEERASFEAERLKALESEKQYNRTISELTLERARLEGVLEKTSQESRQHQQSLQSQQALRASLEQRIAELLASLSAAEGKLAALHSQPSILRSELEDAQKAKAALIENVAEMRRRVEALSAAEESSRQLEKTRQADMERLQAAQRLEITRLEGVLADAGAERARLETRYHEEGRASRLEMESLRRSQMQEIERLEKQLAEASAAATRLETRHQAIFRQRLQEAPQAGIPEPAESHSRMPWSRSTLGRVLLAAGACAVLILAGAGLIWRERNKSLSLRVPFSHPTALVWQGDTLWAADWYEEAVYRMKLEKGKLKVVRRYVLPGVHITGMAVGEGTLFLADSWKREIQRRVMDDTLSLESALPSPGPNPIGLYYDGKYLWTADGTGTIYQQIADISLTVLSAYPSNYPAVAIDADDDRLWTADSRSQLIYARRRDKDLTMLEAFGLGSLDSSKQPLSCFARRADRLWIGRDGSHDILEVPWRSLETRPIPPHGSK